MPCATQNDVDLTQAKRIVANNIKYYIEVANMPTTNEALRFLMDQKNMVVAPSKAVKRWWCSCIRSRDEPEQRENLLDS